MIFGAQTVVEVVVLRLLGLDRGLVGLGLAHGVGGRLLLVGELCLGVLELGACDLCRGDEVRIVLVELVEGIPRRGEVSERARAEQDVHVRHRARAVHRGCAGLDVRLQLVDLLLLLVDLCLTLLDLRRRVGVVILRAVVLVDRRLEVAVESVELRCDALHFGLLFCGGHGKRLVRLDDAQRTERERGTEKRPAVDLHGHTNVSQST